MKNSAKSNIFDVAARAVLDNYAEYVSGDTNCILVCISARELTPAAHKALESSFERLEYGRGRCAYVMLNGQEDGSAVDKAAPLDTTAGTLSPEQLREIVEGIDPRAIVCCDAVSSQMCTQAFSAELQYKKRNRVLGRSIVCFECFEDMLLSGESKQLAWHDLKLLPR